MSRYESLRQNEEKILREIRTFLRENKTNLFEATRPSLTDSDVSSFIQKLVSSKIYKSQVEPYVQIPATENEEARTSSSAFIVIRMNTPNQPARKQKALQFHNGITSELKKLFPKDTVSSSISSTVVRIIVNKFTYAIKFAKPMDEAGTDTDVKEGLSVFYAYYDKQSEPITINNYKEEVGELLKFVKVKSNLYGINAATYKKSLDYLKNLVKAGNENDIKKFRAFANTVNQNMSHGTTFGKFFENNDNFYVERDKLFEEIRSMGSRISGYPKDKWCPGDIYFIRNGGESEIQKRMSLASSQMSDNKEQALATINSLFSDKYLESVAEDTPIVAVSLKMAEAQAGKLKSGFEEYSDAPKEYSLDKEELSYKVEVFREKIKELSDKLKEITTSPDVDIQWNFFDPNSVDDFEIIKFKYASYKAIHFILTKIAENRVKDFDEAIVSLTAFGLGMINKSKSFKSSVNPPFFKVVANKDGSYKKPTLFKGGTPLGLINLSNPNEKPVMKIIDKPTMKGLTIEFGMIIGDENFKILIAFRPNGSTQITVELMKAAPVE